MVSYQYWCYYYNLWQSWEYSSVWTVLKMPELIIEDMTGREFNIVCVPGFAVWNLLTSTASAVWPMIHLVMSIIVCWPMKNSILAASGVIHLLIMLIDLNINISQTNVSVQYSSRHGEFLQYDDMIPDSDSSLLTVNLTIMWTV